MFYNCSSNVKYTTFFLSKYQEIVCPPSLSFSFSPHHDKSLRIFLLFFLLPFSPVSPLNWSRMVFYHSPSWPVSSSHCRVLTRLFSTLACINTGRLYTVYSFCYESFFQVNITYPRCPILLSLKLLKEGKEKGLVVNSVFSSSIMRTLF